MISIYSNYLPQRHLLINRRLLSDSTNRKEIEIKHYHTGHRPMSKYDSVSDQRSRHGSLGEPGQTPDTPGSGRKSRLLRISDSFNAEGQAANTNISGPSGLGASIRRRSSVIGSSRMDPFGTLLVDKDDDAHHDEESDFEVKISLTRLTPGVTSENQEDVRCCESSISFIATAVSQIPAIALIGIFHLMVGIPFGVSYFPMYWSSHPGDVSSESSTGMDDDISSFHEEGQFPIRGKEAFGIRMFLFSTFVGQVVFAYFSGFKNPIGLQMVENIGFTKELAAVAISHQGFGVEALSTVMVMFGIASLMVGIVFFLLGKFQMGKIVYFFPTHVLIGLIGGIGVLLCKTGLENTLAKTVSIASMVEGYNLWLIVVALELILRILEYATTNSKGNAKFALLSPIFFCMITPCFYLTLWVAKIPISEAKQAGYFFPSMNNVGESDVSMDVKFGTPFDLWKVCIELAIAPYKF